MSRMMAAWKCQAYHKIGIVMFSKKALYTCLQIIAFLVLQAAILYITGTLQLLGASFFLSVWLVLEFLLIIGMIFWFHKGEQEVGEMVSHNIGLILVSENNLLHQQLEQIQYLQTDTQTVLEQTDTRIATIEVTLEERLPKAKQGTIRKSVHGTTSQHAAINISDPATAATPPVPGANTSTGRAS